MSRSPSHAHAPKTGCSPCSSKAGTPPPAKIMYITLRQRHGLSHETATRCLREALKRYFQDL
jgi:hypothetical protein